MLPGGGPGGGWEVPLKRTPGPRFLPVGKPASPADAGAADRLPALLVTSYRMWGTVVALCHAIPPEATPYPRWARLSQTHSLSIRSLEEPPTPRRSSSLLLDRQRHGGISSE